jgi:hypothetical protein
MPMAELETDSDSRHEFFGMTADEFTRRLQKGVQDEVLAELVAGHSVYGVDAEGHVYAALPDGRRVLVSADLDSDHAIASSRAS